MLPLDKLRAVRHIVSHINCPDGVASAMILQNALRLSGAPLKTTFLQYDTPDHKALPAEEGMLFCDFSPPRDRLQEFVEAGAMVLDHHKSQKDIVAKFGELGVFADEKAEPGICGASLAFREVWEPLARLGYDDGVMPVSVGQETVETVRAFSRLAGVRDTWQTKDPSWRKACEQAEALTFWPAEELLGLPPDAWATKLELGPILFERKLRGAEKCLEHGLVFETPKGRRVVVFEGLRQTSDAAEMSGDKFDLVIGIGLTAEEHRFPSIILSTRSRKGFDCSAMCQALAPGGGGHMAAAGCRIDLHTSDLQPYEFVRRHVLLYEMVEEAFLALLAERKGQEGFFPSVEYGNLLKGKDIHDDYLLHLNRYQRDNLVWLIAACGYPAGGSTAIPPFVFANSGDWIGEIGNMLDCDKGVGTPNVSLAELTKSVEGWLHSRRPG